MFIIVLALITGINLFPLFVHAPSVWHVQGIYVQSCILIMFCWTFFEKQKFIEPKNIPIGLLALWVGALTTFICFLAQMRGKIDVHHFFPFFNFLCLLFMYRVIVRYLNKGQLELTQAYLRWVYIGTMVLCVLQYFGLSQFFTLLHPDYQDGNLKNNLVSGMIGNGTHLAGFLGIGVPLFLTWKREDMLCLSLLGIILLTMTGETKGDIAVSGIVVAVTTMSYYFWQANKRGFWTFVFILASGIWVTTQILPDGKIVQLLNDNGRFGWWSRYWELAKPMFMTGAGLGSVELVSRKTDLPQKLHFEYLQFLVEIGLIGVVLIGNAVYWFMGIKAKTREAMVYKAMVFGFLINCFFTYPAHLWLTSTYAMISYACVIALKER
jgi:hypothetical protein